MCVRVYEGLGGKVIQERERDRQREKGRERERERLRGRVLRAQRLRTRLHSIIREHIL